MKDSKPRLMRAAKKIKSVAEKAAEGMLSNRNMTDWKPPPSKKE